METNETNEPIQTFNRRTRFSAAKFFHDLESVRSDLGQCNQRTKLRESIASVASTTIPQDVQDQVDCKWDEIRGYMEDEIQAKNWDRLREEIFVDKSVLFFTLIECKAPEDILNFLMELCDDDAMESVCRNDDNDIVEVEVEKKYLLHEACRNNYGPAIVKKIFEYYQDALTLEDYLGMTPLDIVSAQDWNNSGAETYFCIERLNIENAPSKEKAKYFNEISYDRLIKFGAKLKEVQAESIDDAKYVFQEFMKFQGRQGKRDVCISDLVEAPTIFEEVIANTYWVKEALNRKVCSRMYTAVLCFDAYSTIYMTIMYYILAKSFLEGEDVSDYYRYDMIFIIIIIIYFLIREIAQIADTIGKGSMLHYDLWNIADFLRIVTIACSIYAFWTIDDLNDINGNRAESIRELIIITVLSLSLAIFKELKNLFINFAKFVNSLEQMWKKLTSFMISLLLILATFAVCFHFNDIGSSECIDDDTSNLDNGDKSVNRRDQNKNSIANVGSGSNFCEGENIVLKMYYFMLNPDLQNAFTKSRRGKFLYFLSTFVTVVALLNVLIGIVCSSYNESRKDGEIAFWINRLKLIDEIDGIYEILENSLTKIRTKLHLQTLKKSERCEHVDQGHAIWDLLTIAFEDIRFNQKRRMSIVQRFESTGRQIFIEDAMRSKDLRPVITCLIGAIVIPLWFILGLLTFGILWPLQVRAAIFCPKIIVASTESSSNTFVNTVVMKSFLDQIEKKVDSLPSKVCSNLTREEDLFNKKNALQAGARNIQHDIADLKEAVGSLKNDLDVLRKDISIIVENMKHKVNA